VTALLDSLGLFELLIILVVVAITVGGFVLSRRRSAAKTSLPPAGPPALGPEHPECRWCGSPLRILSSGQPATVCAACGREQ